MRGPTRKYLAFGALLLAAVGLAPVLHAQIEGERGIAPINSSGDFLAEDILVETQGKNAFDARQNGWREAQRLGWSKLWRKTHGRNASLSDDRLDGIVSAIEIVEEEIGPRRYKARLNVYFDRARAGQILGVSGPVRRSAPLLVIPVQVSGGAEVAFEQRTPWQRAWARYRTVDSRIDYVRPSGAGRQSLIVNAGQMSRRNREWWRVILDQFGAADVIMPVVEIERKYPGGPIVGRFIARAGPDNRRLGAFTLTVKSEAQLDAMLDQGIQRLDRIYTDALSRGILRPDKSLIVEDPIEVEEIEEIAPVKQDPTPAVDTARDVELSGGDTSDDEEEEGPRNILPGAQQAVPPSRLGPRAGPPIPNENR